MLEHARLTDEMVTLLDKYMDKARMTEAHREVWYRQYYHCETESDSDTDESSLEEQEENEIHSYNDPSETPISGDESDTENECDSVTLGETNSDSFETISECSSDELDGIE